MVRALIIDCDPGVDDAVALLLALRAPDLLDVRAITTAAGNVGAALTARNAQLVCAIAGRPDVPVHAGAAGAIMGRPAAADHFHGASGLGDLPVDRPLGALAPGHAVQALVDHIMASPPGSVDIALLGPMTNLALALLLEPALATRIGQVVAMGGARREGGNITASAEFNIYADPHAAAIVLAAGMPVTLIGLDVSHTIRTTPQRMARLAGLGTPVADAAVRLLRYAERVERDLAGRDGAPLHDPSVIAYLMAPQLFTTQPVRIGVETQSTLSYGHTAIEARLKPGETSHLRWATAADADGVFELLLRRLA